MTRNALLTPALVLALTACSRTDPPSEKSPPRAEEPPLHGEKHIEEANVLELSVEAQKRAGIEVSPASFGRVQAQLTAPGSVQPVDTRVVEVRPLAHGRIQQVFVKIGDRVSKDQALAEFDNIEGGELLSQWNAARAELQGLRIRHANAVRLSERARKLAALGAAAVQEAESAEAEANGLVEAIRAQESSIAGLAARLQRFGLSPSGDSTASATTLRAPFAGVVVRMEAAPGDVVEPSSLLFSLADLSRVYVEAQVYEKDLGRIRIGQPASVSIEAFPDRRFPARVVAIKDVLNPQTRTAAVRCEVDNSQGRLKLEMFASVEFPTSESHRALTVPYGAVQTVNRRQVVFVRRDDAHFEVREVKVLGEGEQVEITAGIKPGDPVVVKGAFQLKSVFLVRELKAEHDEHD